MTLKRLKEIKVIEGTITVLTGLHIGAGSDEIKIGGIDNPVVKNKDGIPYIPGSSLKGKIRTLLEWYTENINSNGKPYFSEETNNPIARIFGNGKAVKGYSGGPTRVSFSDCKLINKDDLLKVNALTESKAEVSINRISGTAADAGPRHMERVPEGAKFDLRITYKIFDMDDDGEADKDNFKILLKGLKLLELDALGGSTSRGYGRIKFELNGEIGREFEKIEL